VRDVVFGFCCEDNRRIVDKRIDQRLKFSFCVKALGVYSRDVK
jgi:hypothetical protein